MRRIPRLVLSLLLLATAVACTGGHSSPTEPEGPVPNPVNGPKISNLTVSNTVIHLGPDQGAVGIGFDYADPDGDIAFVVISVQQGIARNPLPDAVGRTSGSTQYLQSVNLGQNGRIPFSIWLEDQRGNRSNIVDGSYPAN